MFTVSFMILVILGALVVIWVEIPRFEMAGDSTVALENQLLISRAAQLGNYLVLLAWALGAIIVAEVLIQHMAHRDRLNSDNAITWRLLTAAQILCPPLRLAAPSLEMGRSSLVTCVRVAKSWPKTIQAFAGSIQSTHAGICIVDSANSSDRICIARPGPSIRMVATYPSHLYGRNLVCLCR